MGGIPLKFWSHCVLTAVYLINRLPSSILNSRCPYELVYNKKPSLSHLRSFGCLCFSTVLNNHDKLSHRSEKCVLIGYSSTKKAYKLLSLDTRNVFFSREVKFYETVFPFKMKTDNSRNLDSDSESDHLSFFDNTRPQSPYDERRTSLVVDGSSPLLRTRTFGSDSLNKEEVSATQVDDTSLSEGNSGSLSPTHDEFVFNQDNDVQTPGVRRSSRESKMPARFNDFIVSSNVKYGIEKYVCYNKLSRSNYWFATTLNKSVKPSSYVEALKDVNWIDAMNKEIEALTEIIPGEIERYKARRVAKGYSQREGFDYDETFSPLVKMVIVRCLISIAVKMNWSLYQLDVNNAFLYGDLVEDVYMTPQGFDSDNGNMSKFDYSLSVKSKGSVFVALRIEVLKNDKGLCLSQRKYYMELLYEYGLLAARPVETSLPENTVLNFKESEKDKYLKSFTNYQQLVGKLIYLTNTRTDISYVVHCLSQHMHNPLQSHFKAALRVLRYLKQSPGLGLQFSNVSDLKLRSFSDADWAKCPKTSLVPIQIAANPVFHEKTKHFELDVHLVREKILAGIIKTVKVHSDNQNADIFTKCLGTVQHTLFCRNLGLRDMFAADNVYKDQ
ncbi:putative RNA-directed DNA polymerase [Tanacetum coccineum]